MNLKDRIRQVRGTLTQRECATRLGIHTSTWQQYEFGNIPKGDILERIHEEFQVDLNWLLTGKAGVHTEPSREISYPHVTELASEYAKPRSLIKRKTRPAENKRLPEGKDKTIHATNMDSLSREELALVRCLRICGEEYRKRVYNAVAIRASNLLERSGLQSEKSSEVLNGGEIE